MQAGQRVSRVCWGACAIVLLLCGGYLIGLATGERGFSALGFLNLLGYFKLLATLVK